MELESAQSRHDFVLRFPASRVAYCGLAVFSLFFVALVFFAVEGLATGSFLTRWWDWLDVLLALFGYFGGMKLLRDWGAYTALEEAAGYTTNLVGLANTDRVQWPTGVVMRKAGEGRVPRELRRERKAEVRRVRSLRRGWRMADRPNIPGQPASSIRWQILVPWAVGLVLAIVVVVVRIMFASANSVRGQSQFVVLFVGAIAVVLLYAAVRVLVAMSGTRAFLAALAEATGSPTFPIVDCVASRPVPDGGRVDESTAWPDFPTKIGALALEDVGIRFYGRDGRQPVAVALLPWTEIDGAEPAVLGVRIRNFRAVLVRSKRPDGSSQTLFLAPLSVRRVRFVAAGDIPFERLLADIRRHRR